MISNEKGGGGVEDTKRKSHGFSDTPNTETEKNNTSKLLRSTSFQA
ncbi:MAG: hypothetical protein SNJ29_11285 [Rikenellaceae bacterium]